MTGEVQSASLASQQAHRQSVSESVSSITGFLVDLLGAHLTAHMVGADVSTISRWKGSSLPRDDSERRLRVAYQVARPFLAVTTITPFGLGS